MDATVILHSDVVPYSCSSLSTLRSSRSTLQYDSPWSTGQSPYTQHEQLYTFAGAAQSGQEAEQQSGERSVTTLLTGTGPSWELHGPRVARRLRHSTRHALAFLHQDGRLCVAHSIVLLTSYSLSWAQQSQAS